MEGMNIMTPIIFDSKAVTRKVKQKLGSIKNLDLEGALENIDTDGTNYASISEDDSQVVLKVDKKANIPSVMEDVISQLEDYLLVNRKTVNMVFQIHNYNNVIYISRKY